MRIAVGVLACIAVGSANITFAGDPPAAQASPPAASAVSAPANPATPNAAAAPAAAVSQPAVAAESAAPASTPKVDPDVQRLLSQGYRQQMRHGQMLYCKREPVMGSRVDKVEQCGTVEEIKLRTQSSREMTEHAQGTQINPTGH